MSDKTAQAVLAVAAFALLSTGCASIVSGSKQSIAVVPIRNGHPVHTATTCTASNQKGTWTARNGRPVVVEKARDDLHVRCTDAYGAVGVQMAPRTTQLRWAVANFFMWDLCTISCLVDFGNSSIYQYPSQVQVDMEMPQNGASGAW